MDQPHQDESSASKSIIYATNDSYYAQDDSCYENTPENRNGLNKNNNNHSNQSENLNSSFENASKNYIHNMNSMKCGRGVKNGHRNSDGNFVATKLVNHGDTESLLAALFTVAGNSLFLWDLKYL